MRLGLPLLALLALLGLGAVADAQQLEFKRTILTGDERLSYRWRDHEQREFSTVFTLTRQVVRTAESSFRDFSLEAMWRVIEADMREEIDRSARGSLCAAPATASAGTSRRATSRPPMSWAPD